MRGRQLAAGAILAALFLALALLSVSGPTPRSEPPAHLAGPDLWRTLDPAQLSWVIEGIMERKSEAIDHYDRQLDAVRQIMEEKLSAP